MAREKARPAAGDPVDGPWLLPEGWHWQRLGAVGSWGSGGTPKAKTPEYYGGNIPWYKIGDLKDGPLIDSAEQITQLGLANSSAKIIPAGALLIAMYGSIGKLGLTTRDCATNQAIAFCIPDPEVIELHFLFYFLVYRRGQLLSLGQGGTQLNISQTILLNQPVALLPIAKQKLIVQRVETLLTELDDGEAALTQAQNDLATWRKALLKAAVTGELTADWRAANPPTETGADLLARVLAKHPLPSQKNTFHPTPEGWLSVELGHLASLQGGFAFKSEEYTNKGVFLVRIGDIVRGNILPRISSARLPHHFLMSSKGFVVQTGDVLIAMSGATTAKFGRYTGEEPALLNQRVGRFKVSGDFLEKDFLALWLGFWQASILKAAYGGAQPNISSKQIEKMVILLPSLTEQKEIVSRVDESLVMVDDGHINLSNLQLGATALRQSILAAAFRGDLV